MWCSTWYCYLMITLQGDYLMRGGGGGKAFIYLPPIFEGHRKFWSLWPQMEMKQLSWFLFFLEVRLGWQVGAAFTRWIKRAFIVVFLRKWPPACDAIRRRRSFASALWWKLFFSQQAGTSDNLNCQTCALKFGAMWRERGGQRGPGWIASLVIWCRQCVKLLHWINGEK